MIDSIESIAGDLNQLNQALITLGKRLISVPIMTPEDIDSKFGDLSTVMTAIRERLLHLNNNGAGLIKGDEPDQPVSFS